MKHIKKLDEAQNFSSPLDKVEIVQSLAHPDPNEQKFILVKEVHLNVGKAADTA